MKDTSSAGFSYIDVMIAIVILMVGILALLSGMSGAVLMSRGQENQLGAKQIAASTMESIMSVKETKDVDRLGWIALGNVNTNFDPGTGTYRGIFVTGEQNIRADAGPDEVIGTADDTGATIPGMTREIVITDRCDPDRPSPNCPTPGTSAVRIRTVAVTIRYFVGQIRRQEVLTTVLTDYEITE
jgi:type II secretory pathway pseudopilin PulG